MVHSHASGTVVAPVLWYSGLLMSFGIVIVRSTGRENQQRRY